MRKSGTKTSHQTGKQSTKSTLPPTSAVLRAAVAKARLPDTSKLTEQVKNLSVSPEVPSSLLRETGSYGHVSIDLHKFVATPQTPECKMEPRRAVIRSIFVPTHLGQIVASSLIADWHPIVVSFMMSGYVYLKGEYGMYDFPRYTLDHRSWSGVFPMEVSSEYNKLVQCGPEGFLSGMFFHRSLLRIIEVFRFLENRLEYKNNRFFDVCATDYEPGGFIRVSSSRPQGDNLLDMPHTFRWQHLVMPELHSSSVKTSIMLVGSDSWTLQEGIPDGKSEFIDHISHFPSYGAEPLYHAFGDAFLISDTSTVSVGLSFIQVSPFDWVHYPDISEVWFDVSSWHTPPSPLVAEYVASCRVNFKRLVAAKHFWSYYVNYHCLRRWYFSCHASVQAAVSYLNSLEDADISCRSPPSVVAVKDWQGEEWLNFPSRFDPQ